MLIWIYSSLLVIFSFFFFLFLLRIPNTIQTLTQNLNFVSYEYISHVVANPPDMLRLKQILTIQVDVTITF